MLLIWQTLQKRLVTCTAIDKLSQDLFVKEVTRWQEILTQLIAIVTHLAERNLAFRGLSEKLYKHGNGHFWGLAQPLCQGEMFTHGNFFWVVWISVLHRPNKKCNAERGTGSMLPQIRANDRCWCRGPKAGDNWCSDTLPPHMSHYHSRCLIMYIRRISLTFTQIEA